MGYLYLTVPFCQNAHFPLPVGTTFLPRAGDSGFDLPKVPNWMGLVVSPTNVLNSPTVRTRDPGCAGLEKILEACADSAVLSWVYQVNTVPAAAVAVAQKNTF